MYQLKLLYIKPVSIYIPNNMYYLEQVTYLVPQVSHLSNEVNKANPPLFTRILQASNEILDVTEL